MQELKPETSLTNGFDLHPLIFNASRIQTRSGVWLGPGFPVSTMPLLPTFPVKGEAFKLPSLGGRGIEGGGKRLTAKC